ncbi:hypothetical protein ACRS0Q_02815 [Pseudomonas aeruginosa]|uniref:hypothetical protein n=1 Tax=Pseudomonas aeruginosa TaxID=287 RepID=UPI000627D592|nr:hypothetical protein [Pseudomonas aeruginosa]EMA2622957.1 hypothetical protein [Pseudomonas aeruginosa]KKJ51459.1 hypothetical protein T648_15495 [Pseudomonas aeruginosa MRSN 317]KSM27379.1 hypothetical protein APA64_22340 [Pseudomonas aeruginosa]KSP97279.1 hypothetical protein APB29_25370 [Pseudomonas aeruginosa]MCO2648209.1 hypothetical protein [Pseudomonas aeruginosa]
MSLGNVVADRLERIAVGGFDIFKISKEAFSIYQDPGLSLTKDLDVALLSLIAMGEGPEFEKTEKEFQDLLAEIRQM